MPVLLTYILKLSLSLGVVFLFYQLVLRKLTFYTWNRWYLLGYTLLSFLIPFIDISPVLKQNEWSDNNIVAWVPTIKEQATTTTQDVSSSFTALNIAVIVFIAGMIIMLGRLVLQLLSFRRMMKKAKFIRGEEMKIYQVDEEIIPFSFGNAIFINQHLHSPEELQEIILHEFVHVKQKHSLDIILAELLCLFNWYNPFAWLIKRSIRQNLEFIADNKVLENGIGKKQYQYLLLKVIGNDQFSIAQKFNFSSLKKRIAMMNKLKSTRLHLVKFLFILPLLAVILVSFRKQIGGTMTRKQKENTTIGVSVVTDSVPAVIEPNDKGYYIDIVGIKGNCTVVVKDKDRKEVKRMLLSEWDVKEEYYEGLYGKIPPPPPPLPPLPPVQATAAVAALAPLQPLQPIQSTSAVPAIPPVPPLAPVKACDKLDKIVNDYEITETKAVMKLKNGKEEQYDLTDPGQRAVFENKYGKIISTGTNAPAALAAVTMVDATEGVTLVSPAAPMASGRNSLTAATAIIADDNGASITGNEDILITITRKTTAEQLDQFIAQMKEKGVDLKFDDIGYKNGILTHINGTMKYKDSKSVFSATDFSKLILAMTEDGDRVWFKVTSVDNKKIVI
jgi:beta-lactamase regulating signal transducer with metallopeptidase domain